MQLYTNKKFLGLGDKDYETPTIRKISLTSWDAKKQKFFAKVGNEGATFYLTKYEIIRMERPTNAEFETIILGLTKEFDEKVLHNVQNDLADALKKWQDASTRAAELNEAFEAKYNPVTPESKKDNS